jgi:hypothetical protein
MMNTYVDWPTERHSKLGAHILDICSGYGIGLLLKGSIANGTAKLYSDIDVSLYGDISKNTIEKILFGFEKPLMINASEKPPGLLVVAYRGGLSLDLAIMHNGILNQDSETLVLLAPSKPGHSVNDSAQEYMRTIGKNDRYSKISKLIHKGLLKYLNGKADAARGFIKEIIELADIPTDDQSPADAFKRMVRMFIREDDAIMEEFRWLIKEAGKLAPHD